MGLKIGGQVEKIDGRRLSYNQFCDRFLQKNEPVVLTGLMDDWRACRDWVDHNAQPNLHFFDTHFGNSTVQVAECSKKEFTDQARVEMSVSEFIGNWGKISSTEGNGNYSGSAENSQSLLYLKDWHFVKEYPDYVAYSTPLFFRDDWLNLYLDIYHMHRDPDTTYREKNEVNCSDYRFVYMGAKGTWTPFHADVFRSYSWSANVCGKKKWHFLSPSQCCLAFDRNMKNCVYDIFADVSEKQFPGFRKAVWLECTQEEKEIIFVPSGWYHQVHNEADTISINHNWFNAYNLPLVWKLLVKDYYEAKEYIEDIKDICDDFEGLCQRNLAANTGMNFSDFFIFITRFSFANLIILHNNLKDYPGPLFGSCFHIRNLILNLTSIKRVALKMQSMNDWRENLRISLDFEEIAKEPEFAQLCFALHRIYEIPSESCKQFFKVNNPGRAYLSPLNIVEATCPNISVPEDLVRVIDCALEKLSVVTNMGDLGYSSALDVLETLTIS
ncbi:hypothetical protein Syun_024159 [Stephania yunnanensis]|uniref:JmjC domain-containing protein n=1 Tax=Stephania yunnanensis TaxID=152371 RepID=A0AAP0I0A5_9MAGN